MPLVAGIDEAGYGPTLGPLVVGATFWNVPPELVQADYWRLLRDCVRRAARGGQWRLAVNDSKAIYNRKKGLSTLERPVLAFASAAGLKCATLSTLLAQLGMPANAQNDLPWYRDLGLPLPTDPTRSKFDAVALRLKRAMADVGVVCCGLRAAVVTERRFNQRVAGTRNKGAVLLEQVLRLIQTAGQQAGEQNLIVRVDRIGGRSNYRPLLAAAFPERHLHVLAVSDTCSRYRLASRTNDWLIEFAVAADEHHLPVALASMLAKYVREVLMERFNAYWRQQLPTLRATAGYYTDARRFLAEIEPVLATAGVPPEHFVRSR